MALNARTATGGGTPRKRQPAMEAGSYPARLVQVIDLGLQKQDPWQGEPKPPINMIYTTYEILDEFIKDDDGNDVEDKPRWISEDFPLYSLDSDKAKSTKRYTAIDPNMEKDGDWGAIVGYPCIVTMSADENKKGKKDADGNLIVYNNISNVTTMREKDAKKAEKLKNEPKVLDLSNPDLEVYLSLPDWLRDKIKGGLEFEGSLLSNMLDKISEDEEVKKRRESRKEESSSKKESSSGEESNDSDGDDGDDW